MINLVPAMARSALIAAVTAKPSISGICASISAKSYGWPSRTAPRSFSRASLPLEYTRFHIARRNLVIQNLTVGVIIVHNQHPEVQIIRPWCMSACGLSALLFQANRKPKSGAFAQFAFDADLAFH